MSLFQDLVPAVEQQLGDKATIYVLETFQRLTTKENMGEQEAKEAIAECLGMVVDHMYKTKREFDVALYKDLLKHLPDIPERL